MPTRAGGGVGIAKEPWGGKRETREAEVEEEAGEGSKGQVRQLGPCGLCLLFILQAAGSH